MPLDLTRMSRLPDGYYKVKGADRYVLIQSRILYSCGGADPIMRYKLIYYGIKGYCHWESCDYLTQNQEHRYNFESKTPVSYEEYYNFFNG